MDNLPPELLWHNIFLYFVSEERNNLKLISYEFYNLIYHSTQYLFVIGTDSSDSIEVKSASQAWKTINSMRGRINCPNIIGFKIAKSITFSSFLDQVGDITSLPCKYVTWNTVENIWYLTPQAKLYLAKVESLQLHMHTADLLKYLDSSSMKKLKIINSNSFVIPNVVPLCYKLGAKTLENLEISSVALRYGCHGLSMYAYPGLNFSSWSSFEWSQLRYIKLESFIENELIFQNLNQLEVLSLTDFRCTMFSLIQCTSLKVVRLSHCPFQSCQIVIDCCSMSELLQIDGDISTIEIKNCKEFKKVKINHIENLRKLHLEMTLVKSLHWQNCPKIMDLSLKINRLLSLYSDHHLLSKLIQSNHSHLLYQVKSFGYRILDPNPGLTLEEVIVNIPIQQLFKFAIHFEGSYLKRDKFIKEEVLSKMMLQMQRMEYLHLGNMLELQNDHLELLSKGASFLRHINITNCTNIDPKILISIVQKSVKLRKIVLGAVKHEIDDLQFLCKQKGIKLQFVKICTS